MMIELIDYLKASIQENMAQSAKECIQSDALTTSENSLNKQKAYFSYRLVRLPFRQRHNRCALADEVVAKDDLRQKFTALVEQWRLETRLLSSPTRKLEHPAYRKIVELGHGAIRLIFQEINRHPSFLYEALHEILGMSPALPDREPNPEELRQLWIDWGRANNYLD